MRIKSLKLFNFRNYKNLKIDFSDTLNIIYGKNGMGKTNLVEAVYVLALTKSFRTNNDKLLISKEEELFKIEGTIIDTTENNYKITLNEEGKKVEVNNTPIPRLSDYISKLSVIIFSPDDLRIIKSTPQDRRKVLNMQLSQLNNNYLKHLNNYNKVLKQRNAYLKTMYVNHNASKDFLDILTSELIEYGEKIYEERTEYFSYLNGIIADKYSKIAGQNILEIKYLSDFKNFHKEKILKKYKSSENKDIILGKTSIGIHRDDYAFYLNGDSLKDYGSEGQRKNAIISYKLSEIEIFFQKKKTNPILILDDLFSELDNEKIKNILKMIDKNVQTFITTTDINKVSEQIKKKSKIFEAKGTKIKETKNEKK